MHGTPSFLSPVLTKRETFIHIHLSTIPLSCGNRVRRVEHNLALLSIAFSHRRNASAAKALLFSTQTRELFLLRSDPSNPNALVALRLLRFSPGCARGFAQGNSVSGPPDESPQSDLFFVASKRPTASAATRSDAVATTCPPSWHGWSAEIPGHLIVDAIPYFIRVTKARRGGFLV